MPIGAGTSPSTPRSCPSYSDVRSYRGKRCIIVIERGRITVPRTSSSGLEDNRPPGARVDDLVEEAVRVLRRYAPEKLSEP
jgi:hypothetical protein